MTNFEYIKSQDELVLAMWFARVFVKAMHTGMNEIKKAMDPEYEDEGITREEINDILKSPYGFDIIKSFQKFLNEKVTEGND